MFTKYWRNYPWFLQLFLFAMMVLIFLGLASLVILTVIPKITGISVESVSQISEHIADPVTRVLIYRNAIGSFFMFAAPSLLFAYLTHPNPAQYLGFRQPGRASHWFLAIGIMIGFVIVS